MSGRSSEYADAKFQGLLEEYDGDYWRALAEFDGPDILEDRTRYGRDELGSNYRTDENGVEWARIDGFSRYEVSDRGEIRSYFGKEPKILKPWYSGYGYPYIGMTDDNGNKHKFTIHSLVAYYFCPNWKPGVYTVVRHMDDNPRNNDSLNLMYGTPAMNHQDMVDHGREYTKPVYCYETDKTYHSCREAAKELGTHYSSITMACKGEIRNLNNYHVCYAVDKDQKLADLDAWINNDYNPNKKVKAINLETGDSYIFESRKQASKALGIPDCGISSVITGHLKHTHGWFFEDLSKEAI